MIFKTLVGSHAYGTNVEGSDLDYKGIYVQPDNDILSYKYVPQNEVGKDETYYEIKRFLELASSANPTILEMMFIPPKNAVIWTDAYQIIYDNRYSFLTKKCRNSFGGYAVAQIQKAKGLNKKMNWEKSKVERKTVLDFCFIHEHGKSFPVVKWLSREQKAQKYCGLVALDRMKDCYALYYDSVAQYGAGSRDIPVLGYKGISGEDSNDIRLSSIPKSAPHPVAVMYFGKDQYSQHCKDYREYQDWLKSRNTQRYVDISGHNQSIDGKNLLHCRRLIDMGIEIANEGNLTVRRKNADFLLKIRRGEVPLEEIITNAEEDLVIMDSLFKESTLPDDISMDCLNELILKVRDANRRS